MGLEEFEDSTYEVEPIIETEEVQLLIPVNFCFKKEVLDKGDIPELIEILSEEIIAAGVKDTDADSIDVLYGEAREIPKEEEEWD